MPPLLSNFAAHQRYQIIRPLLQGQILDLGCGYTRLPDLLAAGQSYTGVDRWENALNYTRKRYPEATFYRQDLDEITLTLPAAQYDTIVMLAVLEHLHSPDTLLCNLHSYLAPGGKVVITTPSPFGDRMHKTGSRMRLFYSEEKVAHIKIYGQTEIQDLALRTGYFFERLQAFFIADQPIDRVSEGGSFQGSLNLGGCFITLRGQWAQGIIHADVLAPHTGSRRPAEGA